MKKLKKDNPKITFRPDENLRNKFRKKCFMLGISQDLMLIKLIKKWMGEK